MIASLKGFGLWTLGFGLCLVCGSACGRKGPPLPPLQRLPSAVTAMTAKRLGPSVVLQFTIPTTNTDLRGPVEIDHVEVYAHTGPLPAPADFLKFGTLIGNVAVKAPVVPGATAGEQLPGFDLGSVATVSETITPEQMVIGKMPITRATAVLAGTLLTGPDLETPGTVNAPLPLMRYYVAVATNTRNRRGAFSLPLAVPLLDPFATPAALKAEYAEAAVTLAWEPSPRTDDIFAPSPSYNLYEVPDEVVPALPIKVPIRVPVNTLPLALPTFTDPRMEFGARRCYELRAVRVAGAISVESEATPPVCLTMADTFPPAAPKSVVSVANEGAIVLIWEPNVEKDLAGYIVLRGEAADEKLTPLTPMPIHETTYRDTTVKAGVTYVYAVQAVDTAPAPNVSAPSDKVSEVAR